MTVAGYPSSLNLRLPGSGESAPESRSGKRFGISMFKRTIWIKGYQNSNT